MVLAPLHQLVCRWRVALPALPAFPLALAASWVALSGASVAQTVAPGRVAATELPRAERPSPLDPQARVPVSTYQSPLANYRALGEDQRLPWKDANETVNRIGGWRVYLRQAQQPEAAASAPAAAAAPAARPAPAPTTGVAPAPRAPGSN